MENKVPQWGRLFSTLTDFAGGWNEKKLLFLSLFPSDFSVKTFLSNELNTLKAKYLKYLLLKTYATNDFSLNFADFSASLIEKILGDLFFQSYYRFFLSIVRANEARFIRSNVPVQLNWNFQKFSTLSAILIFLSLNFLSLST